MEAESTNTIFGGILEVVYMSDYCKVESLMELDFKGGKKALSFNVYYLPDEDNESSFIAIMGCLCMSGNIYPPSVKRKGGYYSVCYFGPDISRRIYEALEFRITQENLQDKFPLNSFEVATEDMLKKSAFVKMFPSAIGKM